MTHYDPDTGHLTACSHCHDGHTRTGAVCPWCGGTNQEVTK